MTKASLRHITANDEASSLSGDFIIAHHSPAVMKIEMKLWPQNRSFPCNGEKEYETQAAILKFYICADVSHTHTLPKQGTFCPEDMRGTNYNIAI